VTSGIHDRFVEAMQARMRSLEIAHVLDASTQIGPVVDAKQLEQDERYIELARNEGGSVFGGARATSATLCRRECRIAAADAPANPSVRSPIKQLRASGIVPARAATSERATSTSRPDRHAPQARHSPHAGSAASTAAR
jgi:hypothetical protein